MPTGVPNGGTPHASASIAERPNPSASDGTSTALAALIQYGTSAGGGPEAGEVDPSRQHRHTPHGARAPKQPAELARDSGRQRSEGEDGAREPVRARMEQVVAVQRHDHGTQPRRHGGPSGGD